MLRRNTLPFGLAMTAFIGLGSLAQAECTPPEDPMSNLRFDIVGSSTILNDHTAETGQPGVQLNSDLVNTFTLRIENIGNYRGGKAKDIVFGFFAGEEVDDTEMSLYFDLQPGGEDQPAPYPWALGPVDILKSAEVSLVRFQNFEFSPDDPDSKIFDRPNLTAGKTAFHMNVSSSLALQPGDRMEILFELPVSPAASGESTLYIALENVGIFAGQDCDWDFKSGTLELVLDKQPLVMRGRNVGIGTTTPQARLDVVGDGKFKGDLTVEDGRVGIGTLEPTRALDVTGDAIVRGDVALNGRNASISMVPTRDGAVPWMMAPDGESLTFYAATPRDGFEERMRLDQTGTLQANQLVLSPVDPDAPALTVKGGTRASIKLRQEETGSAWQLLSNRDTIAFIPEIKGQFDMKQALIFSLDRKTPQLIIGGKTIEQIANERALELIGEVLQGREFRKLVVDMVEDECSAVLPIKGGELEIVC